MTTKLLYWYWYVDISSTNVLWVQVDAPGCRIAKTFPKRLYVCYDWESL